MHRISLQNSRPRSWLGFGPYDVKHCTSRVLYFSSGVRVLSTSTTYRLKIPEATFIIKIVFRFCNSAWECAGRTGPVSLRLRRKTTGKHNELCVRPARITLPLQERVLGVEGCCSQQQHPPACRRNKQIYNGGDSSKTWPPHQVRQIDV